MIPRPGRVAVGIAEGNRLILVVRQTSPCWMAQPTNSQTAGRGQLFARQLPLIGEVLRGHGAPRLSAGDPAILHNARL